MRRIHLLAAVAVALVASVLAGGIALGAVGDGGVIQGCYDSGGNLKVVPALPCPKGYTALAWNQQGLQGEQGPPGTPGSDGDDGVSPTVAPLPPGDSNCPAGGAAITDSAGTTAYVCSGQDGAAGEPFSGTFASPNGEYSISVTDTGITLSHAPGTTVTLVGDEIRLRSTGNTRIEPHGNLTLMTSAHTSLFTGGNLSLDGAILSLRGAASAKLESSGVATVEGSGVQVKGGGSCVPAARLGDAVSAPGGVGLITSGAPTVCVG